MDDEATSPPRPISGTIGGRVRVLLGSTGKNWMLLTNHDNGDTQWQTTDWKGFTNAVTKQVLNCEKKGRYVKEIAVGPSGAWFVNGVKRNGTGNHSWWGSTSGGDSIKEFNNSHHGLKVSFGTDEWGSESYVIVKGTNGYLISNNVNSGLTSRIIRIHKKKGTIKCVRLFNNDSYFIKDSDGSQWLGLSSHVEKEVKKYDVKDLAIAEDGSWVVIHADHFVCSQGVDDGLQKSLTTFFRLQRERNTQRANAIREYHEGVRRRREAREEAERQRLAREAAEEEERQRLAREAAEEAERQRLAREAAEEAERQRLAREAAEEEERQRLAITQLSALERESDARIQQEMASIKEMEDILVKRKRSIKSIISDMPAKRRASILQAIGDDVDDHHESKEKRVSCVVCHDETALMAVVPCGHHCLCEDCSATIVASPVHSRLCPLCRSYIQSTLKIYSTL